MENYSVVKLAGNGNAIVRELNANVCINTFPSKEGKHLADLYSSGNSANTIVCHGSCAPVNDNFLKTVEILFNINN